jgi:hypothetical protein
MLFVCGTIALGIFRRTASFFRSHSVPRFCVTSRSACQFSGRSVSAMDGTCRSGPSILSRVNSGGTSLAAVCTQTSSSAEAGANDPNDKVSRDEIRSHLSHIAQMFTNGNFQVPMFIHDTVPPGVPTMKSNGAKFTYVFEPIPNGGRVRIKTTDAEALRAVHQFLAFQIDDHRTGDPHVVTASK